MYGWKCLICSLEAKDQVGLELQHIGDGIVYRSGYAAINARIDTILLVSALIKKNQPNDPFSALFWNANSKWVEVGLPKSGVKWVIIKQVTISVAVVKQKQGKHPPPPPPPWHGKDGRRI